MSEYPRTVLEFRDWFADDAACRDYLAKLRWPEGFRCPICRGPDHWVTVRGLRHCRECGRRTSVRLQMESLSAITGIPTGNLGITEVGRRSLRNCGR